MHQFRVKIKSSDYYSDITYYNIIKDWEAITLYLCDIYLKLSGCKLIKSFYSNDKIDEIALFN
jgi:hypothetical protein|nr:hypothetical protein [uncultured bacterium]